MCATVVIDGGYERGACKHHYESVVITGTMRLVDSDEERRHGMRVLARTIWRTIPSRCGSATISTGTKSIGRMSVARLDIGETHGQGGQLTGQGGAHEDDERSCPCSARTASASSPRVSNCLAKHGVNIEDIRQTIISGVFSMTMLVTVDEEQSSFDQVQTALAAVAEDLDVQITLQREDVFRAMHRV